MITFNHETGFTTSRDPGESGKKATCGCGCVHHIGRDGKANELEMDERYMSRLADVSNVAATNGFTNNSTIASGVVKVVISYAPGAGRIAGVKLYAPGGLKVLEWDSQRLKKSEEKVQVVEVPQTPPEGDDDFDDGKGGPKWILGGFWGSADLVVNRLGAVWRRV